MDYFDNFSVKVKNLKCFSSPEQGFERIRLINLIIGRNNSGKSSLLNLIESVINNKNEFPRTMWHSGINPEIIATAPLTMEELKPIFPRNVSGGEISGNHWDFGKKLINTNLSWRIGGPDGSRYFKLGTLSDGTLPFKGVSHSDKYLQRISDRKINPFIGKDFNVINAERNIKPEGDNAGNLDVSGDGSGATNIIQNFINKANLPSSLVENIFLEELNKIFKTDAEFKDIVCQQLDNGAWEIFLEEEKKGRIALSQSGSGLKTIILVLIFLYLVPEIKNKKLSNFVFAFEELENNLHPSLFRRLMDYIYQIAKEKRCLFFLTTHSNVAIDMFSKNIDSQIIHVTHNGTQAYCKTTTTYIDNKGILDDLDVRASDLLQSNGIVWVEGPSDRIYLNRWISILTDGKIIEGTHYQCIFYGGRLLSHLSSEDPDFVDEAVSILKVNRNAAIMIDSDKRKKQTPLNSTKKRIINEFQSFDSMVWVTKGREVENYIPSQVVSKLINKDGVRQVEPYENFFDYLKGMNEREGNKFFLKKPLLAEKIGPFFTRDNIRGVLDLEEKLNEIISHIRRWNSL